MITHHPYNTAQYSASPATAAWPWTPTASQAAGHLALTVTDDAGRGDGGMPNDH